MKKILLTGGAGFLGSHVASQLEAGGHLVYTTDRKGLVDFVGDLSLPEFVNSLPDVDILIHLASVQYVSNDLPFWGRKSYFYRNNIRATKNLVARYRGSIKFAICTSTSMVYSQEETNPLREDSEIQSNGIYSQSKIFVEQEFAQISAPFAIVRPCIIAGPGRGGLFVPLQRTLSRLHLRVVPGRGSYRTSVVDVADVSSLVVLLANSRSEGFFNCAGPDPKSIGDWGQILAAELGVIRYKNVRIPMWLLRICSRLTGFRFLAQEQIAMLSRDHFLDTSRARAIGWFPRSSTADILRETALAFRS